MAQRLNVTLPPNLHLWDGCTVTVAAVDPTDGSIRTDVVVSDVTLQVDDIRGGTADELAVGPFMLVPGPGA